MYDIIPNNAKDFITARDIKLPRFQRKQTWDDKKNFQLCISIFKNYPIGVSILSVESERGRKVRWLLDGRQRKNALTMMFQDPEHIYNWAQKFIGFKSSAQPDELSELFQNKIREYLENDDEVIIKQTEPDSNEVDSVLEPVEEPDETSDLDVETPAVGTDLLLNIILMIHNKKKGTSGFTRPFDFTKYVQKLPYLADGNIGFSSRKLKTFISEYSTYCADEGLDHPHQKSFYQFLESRCDANIKNPEKLKELVKANWTRIRERIQMVEDIETTLSNAKIGLIEVQELEPSDYQKIFNIINSEGAKLTAVEILSAKPSWNIHVNNPTQATKDAVDVLYKTLGTTVQEDVVRWDLPATLLKRIGKNLVIKEYNNSKTEFEKELTIGFKIFSGIYEGAINKDAVERLSKSTSVDWDRYDEFVSEMRFMLKVMSSMEYFKYLNSWRINIMELTSEACALDFLIIAYKDWKRKGGPVGTDAITRRFQKNCFILWDKLVYEYVTRQWWGASDAKVANQVSLFNSSSADEYFQYISKEKWMKLLNEVFEKSSIDDADIKRDAMEAILYHFYALKHCMGPESEYDIEVDHIIPQDMFKSAVSIDRNEIVKDNILNLALLPKSENASKNNKKLIAVDADWLKDCIERYEFIPRDKFLEFSDISNYRQMFDYRKPLFEKAFTELREKILNS